MAIEVKIQCGILAQDYLNNFASDFYRQNAQANIDLSSDKDKKKWRKILNLSEKEFEEAVKKFGTKIRDIRIGLRHLREPK